MLGLPSLPKSTHVECRFGYQEWSRFNLAVDHTALAVRANAALNASGLESSRIGVGVADGSSRFIRSLACILLSINEGFVYAV